MKITIEVNDPRIAEIIRDTISTASRDRERNAEQAEVALRNVDDTNNSAQRKASLKVMYEGRVKSEQAIAQALNEIGRSIHEQIAASEWR